MIVFFHVRQTVVLQRRNVPVVLELVLKRCELGDDLLAFGLSFGVGCLGGGAVDVVNALCLCTTSVNASVEDVSVSY
jgi:uncharacterized protein YebE (UPF0316 family)